MPKAHWEGVCITTWPSAPNVSSPTFFLRLSILPPFFPSLNYTTSIFFTQVYPHFLGSPTILPLFIFSFDLPSLKIVTFEVHSPKNHQFHLHSPHFGGKSFILPHFMHTPPLGVILAPSLSWKPWMFSEDYWRGVYFKVVYIFFGVAQHFWLDGGGFLAQT